MATRKASSPRMRLKKRIALTLPDDINGVLREFAALEGKPVSSTIVELLRHMAPQLEGLTKMHRQLESGKVTAARQTLQHVFGDAMAAVLVESQPELFQRKGSDRAK